MSHVQSLSSHANFQCLSCEQYHRDWVVPALSATGYAAAVPQLATTLTALLSDYKVKVDAYQRAQAVKMAKSGRVDGASSGSAAATVPTAPPELDSQYKEHLDRDAALQQCRDGLAFKGVLTVSKHGQCKGSVRVPRRALKAAGVHSVLNESGDEDIIVMGLQHMNRAVHGDEVVVRLLPPSQWVSGVELSALVAPEAVNSIDDDDETANASLISPSPQSSLPAPPALLSSRRPTGTLWSFPGEIRSNTCLHGVCVAVMQPRLLECCSVTGGTMCARSCHVTRTMVLLLICFLMRRRRCWLSLWTRGNDSSVCPALLACQFHM